MPKFFQKAHRAARWRILDPFSIFLLFLVSFDAVKAAVLETVHTPSSPIPSMSLSLEAPTGVDKPGQESVLLTDQVLVAVTLGFASNITIYNTSVFVAIPWEFSLTGNVSVALGDNVTSSIFNNSVSEVQTLTIDLGTLQNSNTSSNLTEDGEIRISFSAFLFVKRDNIGDVFFFSASVEFTESVNETSQVVTNDITYAGPGIRTQFQNSGFSVDDSDFVPDRETVIDVFLDFPPYNLSDVSFLLGVSSSDVPSLDVDSTGMSLIPSSNFITYDQPSIPSFSCVSNSCSLSALDFGSVYAVNGTLHLQISFIVSDDTLNVGDNVILQESITLNGGFAHVDSLTLNTVKPDLTMVADAVSVSLTEVIDGYTYQYMRFTTTVSHTPNSTGPASQVSFYNTVSGLSVDLDTITPDPFSSAIRPVISNSRYTLDPGVLEVGETAVLSYTARLTQSSVDENIETDIQLNSQLTWSSLPADEETNSHPGVSYGPVSDTICITQTVTYEESLLYNHGLPALFFFVALILALVIVILACFIYAKMSAGGIYAIVQPEGTISKNEHGLIINPRVGKTGVDMVEEYSSVTANESIVVVLMQKDKTRKILEFENLDIMSTITTDMRLEEQRISTMIEMFIMLLGSWSLRDLLPRSLSEKLSKKYQRSAKDAIKKLDDEYRHESRELIKHLSNENKGKLIMLKKKHDAELRLKAAQARSLSKEDLKEVLALLKKQQAAEATSMTQLLRLKQDEEQEKLRKEYATKKRIAMKAVQQEYMDKAILQGKLDEDEARRLLSEHQQDMSTVERLMDEEMSKQRMSLEEKLGRRKLLAKATESQEEHHSALLNTMASQTMTAVNELEQSEQLSQEAARAYMDKLMKEVKGIKDNYEKERRRQEEVLHKRLSEKKKKRMQEKERDQKQELAEFEKKKANVGNGELDPAEYFESKSSVLAGHRSELAEIEREIDEEAREELEKLRDEMSGKVKGQITNVRQKVHIDLQNKGLTERQAAQIIEQHERDVMEMQEQREEQKQKQEKAIKKRLAKQRKELALRKQEEREEREQIREHEEKMVGRLLASQVAMSEEERRRILAEHEQHLVAMENSLALTKLRQRRLLEEKMAGRKNRQMERLARKQEQEAKRKLKDRKLHESDDEDDDANNSGLKDLMQKHTKERMAMMADEDEDRDKLEEELEAVRSEMLNERANALKEQEDRLGAVMAQLQMQKARELATIEEQHKALLQLKMNMLDELTEKGIMKNAQCKKVIETHQKQVEAMDQKMKKQRAKAEAVVKKKLREKAMEREKSLALKQEEEIQRLLEREKNGTAARLKRVALKHKHMVEMEEFRNKLEVEVTQTLEEIRRQSEMTRINEQQEQELDFLSALVKVGNYDKTELINVLHLLFPAKSHDQVNEMLAKLYEKVEKDGNETDSSPNKSNGISARSLKGDLESKVKEAILGQVPMTKLKNDSLTNKGKKKKAKKLAPLRSADQAYDSDNRSTDLGSSMRGAAPLPQISSSRRPEPLGQTADSEDDRRRGGYDDRSDGEGTEDDERSLPRKRPSISGRGMEGPSKGKRASLGQVRAARHNNMLI
ncbi:limbin-like isoform X1 [Lytechinus pictus]|uniref:limbin-like isoform X1 n=1 Tax=Lytechinus pictus TaxID=7653 RepID=UPI0030B9C7CD